MSHLENFLSPFFDPAALVVVQRHLSVFPADVEASTLAFPWMVSRQHRFKMLELAGRPYADYRSVVNPKVTLNKLLELKKHHYTSSIMELGGIAEKDFSHEAIMSWIRHHDLIFRKQQLLRAPYLNIDGPWDSYRAGKKRKFWYNISRAQKLLEEEAGKLDFNILTTPEQISQVFPACMALYRSNWNRVNSSSLFLTDDGCSFLRDLLHSLSCEEKAEICILEQKGTLLAFSIGLKYNLTYYFYIFATLKEARYERYSVGKILIRNLLETVFERKFQRFDFMAGEEPYKYEWTKLSQERTTYYVTRNNVLDKVLLFSFLSLNNTIAFLKRRIFLRRMMEQLFG